MGILSRRQRRMSKLESTGLVKFNGDSSTLITDNGDGTININHSGLFDRIVKTDPGNYESETISGNWIATNNIDHTAAGADGNVLIIVDRNGVISIIQLVSGNAFLPSFSTTEPDLNSHIQIGILTKTAGSIFNLEPTIVWNGNVMSRLRYLIKEIGVLTSLTNPSVITAGGNLELNVTSGDRLLIDSEGAFLQTDGMNPEQVNDNALTSALIVKALRDDSISSQSLDLDVNNIEDINSPGMLVSKGASRASNNFMLTFQTFIVQIYGQIIYSGGTRIVDASQANESSEIPGIALAGGKIVQISVDNAETDLDNAIFKKLNRFN